MSAADQNRVAATPAALELIAELTAEYGPVIFHQSGGCCDGSSPMCYPAGDFVLGVAMSGSAQSAEQGSTSAARRARHGRIRN